MKDGGPAFPHGSLESIYAESGMSLRDWFAGQALSGGWLSEQAVMHSMVNTPMNLAKEAYNIADAMLAEREKQ